MTLHISPDGTVRFVAEPTALQIAEGLGEIKSRRASRIVPACPRRRLAFRILRAVFGDSGRVATWTRAWQGPWQVRFTDSPSRVSFSHASRAECLKWEIQQLNERLSMPKIYLGDSVYAAFDGCDITLTTENGFGPSNTIVLEPGVYRSLVEWSISLETTNRKNQTTETTGETPP